MKMDALTRKVLSAYVADPAAEAAALAASLEIGIDVVVDRIARLRADGVIKSTTVHVDGGQVGYPYEAFILAVPSAQTTRDELEALAASSLVTRMFTLATRRSIAFTVLGTHPDDVFLRGETLAAAAHLEDVASVMLVDTLTDNGGAALAEALMKSTIAAPPVPVESTDSDAMALQETS